MEWTQQHQQLVSTTANVSEGELLRTQQSSDVVPPPGVVVEEDTPSLPGGMTMEQLQAKVKELFPGFTPNSILRFSSLLGPGKPSSMPRLWEGCRKPKRKKKPPNECSDPNEWTFNFGPVPSEDMLDNDDKSFMAPVESNLRLRGSKGEGGKIIVDEETSEWRFGPAQYWYDLYGFPEDGRGFDYGFRLKVHMFYMKRESYYCMILYIFFYS